MTIRTILASLVICTLLPVAAFAQGTILVAGATGQSGRLIVTALLEKGFTVRAMSRSAERAASLGEGVEPAVADVTDPSSLSNSMDGVDAVLSAIGGRRPIGSNGFEAVDWEGNRALIDAAKAAGVKRFLVITAGSAGRDGFIYTLPFGPYPWKAKAETYLRESGLDYTIVGPGGLRDEPAGRYGVLLTPRSDYVPGPINRGDVAEVMVASLLDDSTIGKTITMVNDITLVPDAWRAELSAFPLD
ncbi:MAG: NAD(P)H-binding protein [Alphaproteobacteria bacterium]|nr:NAD(P)H-binding protein [Alphaproteobacteria bacterium]